MQRLDILHALDRERTETHLEDVGLLVGEEDEEVRVQWLINVSHSVRLDISVFRGRNQLGEGGEETFDAGTGHVHVLPRQDGCRGQQRGGQEARDLPLPFFVQIDDAKTT
jgi:hypothetical protein